MKTKDEKPLLIGAWGLCAGGFVLVDRDRRIWTWSPSSRSDLVPMPVPGSERIVGVDAGTKTVIFDTGEKMSWFAGNWNRLPGLLDAATAGTLKVLCISGVCLGPPRGDLNVGDIIDLAEAEARKLLAAGHVELVPIDEHAAA